MSNLDKHLVPLVPLVHSTNGTNGTNNHRYILDRSSKKHLCPSCDKLKFVKYIDTETGEYLPEQYGRCDRESKCSYHLNPYKDGYGKNKTDWKPYKPVKYIKPKPKFIPVEVLKQALSGYEQNIFIQNLISNIKFPFDVTDIENVVSLYRLGTVQNGYRSGAITFPFIDINNNVRAIQVKQFDEKNHTTGTDFLHSIIDKHYTKNNKPLPEWLTAYKKNDIKVSCLFGEHLLSRYPHNPIALVEAPKTAIYGTLYFGLPKQPTDLLWLAVYNLSSLNFDKCKELKGRNIYLFPDNNGYDLWNEKALEIESKLLGSKFTVSDLLEDDAAKGSDLADYIIKQDWRLFRKQPTPQPTPKPLQLPKEVLPKIECKNLAKLSIEPLNWDKEIEEIKSYFKGKQLPATPFQLNDWTTIIDMPLFVNSHIGEVIGQNGNYHFRGHLDRLIELKRILN